MRADDVQMALMARGYRLEPVHADSLAVLSLFYTLRCLAFVEHTWHDWLGVALRRDVRQPFSSVLACAHAA